MVRKYQSERVPAKYSRSEIPTVVKREGVTQSYFRGLDILVGFTTFEPTKPRTDPHSHPWEQINYVLEGSCRFHVGDQVVDITEGDMFVIPPDVPHTSEPPEERCVIQFISPLREDYIENTSYQTEFYPDNDEDR